MYYVYIPTKWIHDGSWKRLLYNLIYNDTGGKFKESLKNIPKVKDQKNLPIRNRIKAESMLCWSERSNLVSGKGKRVGRGHKGTLALLCVCVCVLVTQSCLTLWDPMDCIPPGSSVHGILQARTLEWVAIPISRVNFIILF